RALNIFKIFSDYHIVDLPGYGYSNMSKQTKIYWNKMIFKYLMFRRSLKGIVLCMDIRNPIKLLDQKVLKIAIKKN
ncbi:YihA family ribosome biogenesis GTP-binding protein, partial [Buchnera aphidicola (Hormaphis cornu)]